MKFAEHLAAHITPEWRKQYISYEELKARLYYALEKAPSPELVDQEVIVRYYMNFDEEFLQLCEKELTNINTFFSEKLAEATRKYANLIAELKTNNRSGRRASPRKIQDMKLAFSEYYLSLILLQNYQNLNFTGFRKILKKHDKVFQTDSGARWREQNVDVAVFYKSKEIERLISETETTFALELEDGDRQKAMKRLRVPPLNEQKSPWTTFKVGLFSGSFIVLLIAATLSAIFHQGKEEDFAVVLKLYRCPLFLIQFIFLIGVNVYGWRSSGVNHVLIFELDPRNHLSEQDLIEIAAIFGVVWALSILSFLYSSSLSIPPYINPLVLMFTMVLFLVNPIKIFRYDARFWLLKVLGRILTAPLFSVGFADFWLADQLNSLALTFLDFYFLICFYAVNQNILMASNFGDNLFGIDDYYYSKAIVNCLPAWFRFAQCLRRYYDSREAFPHLANAAKYSTTFFVVIFSTLRSAYESSYESDFENPFFYLWIISCVTSSIYTYVWDIRMDWGLMDVFEGDNKLLREEIVYGSPKYYYCAMIEDLIIRFQWIAIYVNQRMDLMHPEIVITAAGMLEVNRRFVWNFFRLENEHLNNCGKFRAVRDISVAPIHSTDAALIEKMMDEEDGVINRKKRKVEVRNRHDKTLFKFREDRPG